MPCSSQVWASPGHLSETPGNLCPRSGLAVGLHRSPLPSGQKAELPSCLCVCEWLRAVHSWPSASGCRHAGTRDLGLAWAPRDTCSAHRRRGSKRWNTLRCCTGPSMSRPMKKHTRKCPRLDSICAKRAEPGRPERVDAWLGADVGRSQALLFPVSAVKRPSLPPTTGVLLFRRSTSNRPSRGSWEVLRRRCRSCSPVRR